MCKVEMNKLGFFFTEKTEGWATETKSFFQMEISLRFTILYFHFTSKLTCCIDNCISGKLVLVKSVDYLQVFENSQVS